MKIALHHQQINLNQSQLFNKKKKNYICLFLSCKKKKYVYIFFKYLSSRWNVIPIFPFPFLWSKCWMASNRNEWLYRTTMQGHNRHDNTFSFYHTRRVDTYPDISWWNHLNQSPRALISTPISLMDSMLHPNRSWCEDCKNSCRFLVLLQDTSIVILSMFLLFWWYSTMGSWCDWNPRYLSP